MDVQKVLCIQQLQNIKMFKTSWTYCTRNILIEIKKIIFVKAILIYFAIKQKQRISFINHVYHLKEKFIYKCDQAFRLKRYISSYSLSSLVCLVRSRLCRAASSALQNSDALFIHQIWQQSNNESNSSSFATHVLLTLIILVGVGGGKTETWLKVLRPP